MSRTVAIVTGGSRGIGRAIVRRLLERHAQFTGSPVAERILGDWLRSARDFVKVMPRDYRRALERSAALSGDRSAALSGPRGDQSSLLQVANG